MIIKFRSILIFSSILFIFGSFSSFTYLQYEQLVVAEEKESEGDGQRRPHRGPPSESKEACSGKNEGDSCGFTSPYRGEINGDCRTVKNGDVACVPEGGPPGRGGNEGSRDGKDSPGY